MIVCGSGNNAVHKRYP